MKYGYRPLLSGNPIMCTDQEDDRSSSMDKTTPTATKADLFLRMAQLLVEIELCRDPGDAFAILTEANIIKNLLT